MKILLVVDDLHPRSGGPPAVVVGSALALAERDHSVTILSAVNEGDEDEVRSSWPELQKNGVILHLCRHEGIFGLLGFSQQDTFVSKIVRDADVVHIHGVWTPILILAGRIAGRAGKPYFISTHGVFDYRAMTRIKWKWLKKRLAIELFGLRTILDNAKGVIFGSEAEATQSWLPSANMRLTYVPNGADLSLGTISPTKEQLKSLEKFAPEISQWQTIILCRSRIHEEKGIDLLVQAFNSITSEFPKVGLFIAGLKQDEHYQSRIEELIANGPAPDRIVLTTALTGPRTNFLYQVADIFAMPSLAEGFSMGLIEGLANGRPILLTRFCHMQIVEESGAGTVVDSNPESLADGLRALLAPSLDLKAMGMAARRLFEENYSWEHVAAKLESVYFAKVG